VFSSDAGQTYISPKPPEVAVASAGGHERWTHKKFQAMTVARASTALKSGRDYLRVANSAPIRRPCHFNFGECCQLATNTMHQASTATISAECEQTRSFTATEFLTILHSEHLVSAFAFWRVLEQLATPEARICSHARGVLTELARPSFAECRGEALSPQHGAALRYCGFEPTRVAAPGEFGSEPLE
jgi:hypothetical protein